MTQSIILFRYDGKWKTNEQENPEWCSGLNGGCAAISTYESEVLTIAMLKDGVCEKCGLNKDKFDLKFSYLTHIGDVIFGPTYLSGDKCLQTYLLFGDAHHRPLLHVEIMGKNQIIRDNIVDSVYNFCDEGGDNANFDIYPDEHFDGIFILSNGNDIPSSSKHFKNGNEEHNVEENIDENVNFSMTQNDELELHHSEVVANDDQNFLFIGSSSEQGYSFTDESNLSVGKEFNNKKDVQRELHNISVKASFEMRVIKSTKTLYWVRCLDETCSWFVRVARKNEDSSCFSIPTYCKKHTCDLANRNRRHRQASSAVVADTLVETFRGQQKMPSLKAIRSMMQNNGSEISYFKAWKGKQLALNQLRGDPVESFRLLPAYLYMLEQVNPGSTTSLKVNSDDSFKYMFLAYKTCIDGFKYMRKVISVDGTYLKGKYKGVLLIATAQDGNHHQYPIAWAVVDSESEKSWTWFFEKLHDLIPENDELVFISDRHKGIINGLASVYKQTRYEHCLWHIGQNIKTRLKSKAGGVALFMRTAKAYTQMEFDELYREMNSSYPSITKYLEDSIDQEKWARAYFHGSRYNIMTTNGSESINAKLASARELPIIALLDAIQSLISSWFNTHRITAIASTGHLTPWAERTLRSRFIESQKMEVFQLNTFEYHVTAIGHDAVVGLSRRTCRCRVFDIDRLPCAHAIAAAGHHKMNIYELCSHYYTTSVWMLAYTETVYPVPPSSEWNVPIDIASISVLPPKVRVRKGRTKKKRIPSIGEFSRRKKRYVV